MFRFIVSCIALMLSTVSFAQAPFVVATHPIYLIAKEITKGVEEPELLLKNQSGHDVQLTPAHRKAMQDASLVLWLGKAHEAPLANVLQNNPKAVSILDSKIINTLPQRSVRGEPLANTTDSHVWLDPNNAVRIGFFIAALRSQQYPANKAQYMQNAQNFAKAMLKASQVHQTNAKSRAYWSYHDAYQYLERPLNLKLAGALTSDPGVAPTATQLKYLKDNKPNATMCLLAEGDTNQNQYKVLNPVVFQAVDESMNADNNFIIGWQKLASQIANCVSNASK